ncbi:hypothetical protein EYC84_001963 [Monilinia fructicola]|uniref:Uncharacterized protein n=1 Tax=Monilinia fructicola TaxID=38448 RepID=A0A5M9JZB1_MONFR|nr:hypothetical protein EYC84_001963 [Monilinia fructicola]
MTDQSKANFKTTILYSFFSRLFSRSHTSFALIHTTTIPTCLPSPPFLLGHETKITRATRSPKPIFPSINSRPLPSISFSPIHSIDPVFPRGIISPSIHAILPYLTLPHTSPQHHPANPIPYPYPIIIYTSPYTPSHPIPSPPKSLFI